MNAAGAGAAPPVSIGMPVYNGERYVGEAIDSVLAQTDGDFELIVSDNASRDRTEAICRDYAARDRRVRFYRARENRGASWNFERVFRLARGRYFRWCAADDRWEPELLARTKLVLDRRPDVILAYPRTNLIDSQGRLIRRYEGDLDVTQDTAVARYRHIVRKLGLCHAMFGLMRAEVLRQTSLIASYSGSDQVLLAQLAILGKLLLLPEYLFNRRLHERSSSSDISTEGQQQFYDPQTRGKLFLRCWRHTSEHWSFVARADMPIESRGPIILELLRLLCWNRVKLGRELFQLCAYPAASARRLALPSRQ
jgi:glycosyltransferase involved in cell wall biosynthesis